VGSLCLCYTVIARPGRPQLQGTKEARLEVWGRNHGSAALKSSEAAEATSLSKLQDFGRARLEVRSSASTAA